MKTNKTKQNKKLEKKCEFYFVLAKYSWDWGLTWNHGTIWERENHDILLYMEFSPHLDLGTEAAIILDANSQQDQQLDRM